MNKVESVVLFVVDGMRPDALALAPTPAIHSLMARGAHTLTARTVMPSITLPTHMSMFHSVLPQTHGVQTNTWQPASGDPLPGIMELAHQAGRKTAAFYTWEELRDLWRPGSLTYSSFVNLYGPNGMDSDQEAARLAAEYIVRERPNFTFLYLGLVDEIGHRHGWLSPEYLAAVAGADAAIGHVLQRLKMAELLGSTACLVTADHGGHERAHGAEIAEDMLIPWVLAGPGVKPGSALNGTVSILDTAATIAILLDLPAPAAWRGRAVLEALE